MKIGDLIRWIDYHSESEPIEYVGLYVADIPRNVKCWTNIKIMVGQRVISVCSWQCEVINESR